MISAPPANAPFPAETVLQPSAQGHSAIALASCDSASDAPCSIPVQVGVFFDGTNNNQERDREGKRIGLPDPRTKIPAPMASKPLAPDECCHSNVVRLFRAFPGDKPTSGYFSYYIPGVGTPFKEIGELTETAGGKRFATGGESRIIFGLLQIINAVHRAVYKRPLYKDDQAGQFAQSYGGEVGRIEQRGNGKGPVTVMTHRKWFAPHLARLKAALVATPKPTIPSLTISVFGFSRGAAEAVAFCHLFDELLEAGRLAGIQARISFLGVFDTVASVGGSASIASTLPLPGAVFDGHWWWADRLLDPLPDCVHAGRHFISAHELRMNFPVTRLQGNIEEVYYPGVHSDVGGGYAPGDQGKGRGKQAALLSQIPLLHMYQAAREAGVPLVPFSELDVTVQDDMQVDAALASAWTAYTAALGEHGAFLTTHMELYYRWRAARLDTLETTASFRA
ncbi:T6SS phospholipase effector Tle1-like catalytic domain-containing protein, partial [Aromatoleum diolicum]